MITVNWNMQGANHSSENKWNQGVLPLFSQLNADVCLLQECGGVPASATLLVQNINNDVGLNLYKWGGTSTRGGLYILSYSVDPNDPNGRCNLAVVSRTEPSNATLMFPIAQPIWRPIIGMVINRKFFGSIHAISPNGPDAPGLMTRVTQLTIPWIVGGDFNRTPDNMANPSWVINPPIYPTYPATMPDKKYDYSIVSSGNPVTGNVLDLQMSDHLPVIYTF